MEDTREEEGRGIELSFTESAPALSHGNVVIKVLFPLARRKHGEL